MQLQTKTNEELKKWVDEQVGNEQDLTDERKLAALQAFQKAAAFEADPLGETDTALPFILSDMALTKAVFAPADGFIAALKAVLLRRNGLDMTVSASITSIQVSNLLNTGPDAFSAEVKQYVHNRVFKPTWFERVLTFFGQLIGFSSFVSEGEAPFLQKKDFAGNEHHQTAEAARAAEPARRAAAEEEEKEQSRARAELERAEEQARPPSSADMRAEIAVLRQQVASLQGGANGASPAGEKDPVKSQLDVLQQQVALLLEQQQQPRRSKPKRQQPPADTASLSSIGDDVVLPGSRIPDVEESAALRSSKLAELQGKDCGSVLTQSALDQHNSSDDDEYESDASSASKKVALSKWIGQVDVQPRGATPVTGASSAPVTGASSAPVTGALAPILTK